MAITQVGTPNATVFTTASGGASGVAFSGSQPRTAGDILVFVITAAATTTVTAPTTPAGWNVGAAVGNSGTINAYTVIFWKIAAGSDTAPATTVTFTGTGRCGFSLFELTGNSAAANPVDTTGTFASGASAGTIASMTVTGSSNVAYSGEYAIAAFAREQGAAAVATYTKGSTWTNFSNDGATSSRDHNAVDTWAGPTQGSAASDAATITSAATSFAAGALVTFAFIPTPGPPLYPLQQPAGKRVVLVLAGQAMASQIPLPAAAPTAGPVFYPVSRACRARSPRAGFNAGLIYSSMTGLMSTPGPMPLYGSGRVLWSCGSPAQNPVTHSGPPLYPLKMAVRAKVPQIPVGLFYVFQMDQS